MSCRERPACLRSDCPPSRAWYAAALTAALILACLPRAASAQAPPHRAGTPLQNAQRAFVEGRYDEVDQLTDRLDARDPEFVAMRARAAIARGRYAQAEQMLRPVAAKAPASEAALRLGLLEQMLGRPDAAATLDKVAAAGDRATSGADLARAARALRALGHFQEANAAYRDAVAAAPDDPAINTGWGELFLEKYNSVEAVRSFQAALQVDARWEPALVGFAEALADDNPPQSMEIAKRALEINPSDVGARIFIARQAIDEGRHAEARQALQRALAVNPSSLEAHAWLAALAYIEDKDAEYDAEIGKALAVSPSYGDAYRIAGEMAARNYRFDDAVALTRRALALDPDNPRTLADLGLHLLRTGDEPGARASLEASFKIDPYNVVTYNLLGMMDTLDAFATVRDGDLVVRMQKDEAPVLGEYTVALAHEALTALAKRYEFTPRGPILIEIFTKQDDFAVENVGLPGMIGALGACFGRVVTMDSPSTPGLPKFQWEATLWHELAHVITLQMSNQRVPRWLTEGISVFEEKRAHAEWARQMDVEFAGLLNSGDVVKLRDLNASFTDPRKISLAYYEASLLVEHLVTSYGDAGLQKLLRAYGQGLDTDAALKSALNTDLDRLQAGFDQSLERQFGGLRRALEGPDEASLARAGLETLRADAADHPRSYPVQMSLGQALVRRGQPDEAMQAYERAAALIPIATGKDSPHARLAELALAKGDQARAITELQALVAVDFDNLDAARQLAGLLRKAGVTDEAKLGPVYARIAAIDPFDADAHRELGRLDMARDDAPGAEREFRVVLALKPVDEAAARTDLAESYFKAGKPVEAKKQTLAALEIAPTYERAQTLLLKLVGQPVRRLLVAAALVGFAFVPALQPPVDAQLAEPDARLAGLEWRFVRIRYHFRTEGTTEQGEDYVGEPWYIDAPAAEQNLSRRVKTATTIHVEDPLVLTLDDPRLFEHPWIYFVEGGNLKMHDSDVAALREFLLRGGTATFDDFHGPYEWENVARELKRVFPDREIVEVPKDHPVFSCFYKIPAYPQVAGLGSFLAGRSWEKGGFVPHLRTILDDAGRPMVFINWNTDMGDGWEWSNVEDYPGYIKYTALAYRMAINEIVYALTH